MKSTVRSHVQNPFPVIRRIVRRKNLLSAALGAFLLTGATGFAVQPQANMTSSVLAPAASLQIRAATAAQQKLAAAAAAEGVQIEWNGGLGTPLSIRGQDLGASKTFSAGQGLKTAKSAKPEANAIAVLDNLSGIMGIRNAQNEFAARPAKGDTLGFRHVRTEQTYQGLKVFGGEVIVHFNKEGTAYQVNGRYVPDIAVNTTPALDPAKALALAAADLAGTGKSAIAILSEPELVVFAYNTTPHLAYALTLTADPQELNAWRYWIDAQDGTVLMRYNNVKSVDITGGILAGEGGTTNTVTDCSSSGGTNYLESMAWQWVVYNFSEDSTLYPDANQLAFRTNTTWLPEDRTEMSAAVNFDHIQQYYWNVHGRNSFDDDGAWAFTYVHFGTEYVNAFWDGFEFVFGDGDGTEADPLTVLDVAGHEFTHAVTEYSANLVYANESGALNESFSDIFGTCVEFYSQPDGSAAYPNRVAGQADWLCGEDCWLSSTALRDLRNPTNTLTVGFGNEQPSYYKGTFWYYGSSDNGGVHYNGGVQSFFFYLLSEGGSGENDGHAYNVTGIGLANAAQIAYRTLTVYCFPYTDYTDIRSAWIAAAQDLNPTWVTSVVQAWEAVGYGKDTVVDLGAALNAPYLTWYSGGSRWYGQSLITHDGVAAAQSGLMDNNSFSRLTTTFNGSGTLTFWWNVWSRQNYDYLSFSLDNILKARISGIGSWAQCSFTVGAGAHTSKWVYSKSASGFFGLDAGWVDQVSWAPDWAPTLATVTATSGTFSDKIRVTWTAMSGATGYRLYRSSTSNPGAATLLAESSSLLYDDTAVVPGMLYYYWVQGVNCATYANWSAVAPGYRALVPPMGFSASKGDYTSKVLLTWTAAEGAVSYRIMRNTIADTNTATAIVETGATSYNDTTAVPGTTYYYWLISRKWRQVTNNLQSAYSSMNSGWRRSMAASDNATCDFDGDGKADPAVYKKATGLWMVMMSANNYRTASFQLGGSGYQPVPQDFDGDGETDIAVYSPTTGEWIALLSGSGYASATASLGGSGYTAVARDYDGDGKADPAVFQQNTGYWKILYSSLNYALVSGYFGDSSYSPCPADFDNDGKTDPSVFKVQPSIMGDMGWLLAAQSASRYAVRSWSINPAGQSVPQDYDGDGKADPALYDAANSLLSYWPSSIVATMPFSLAIGGTGFVAVAGDYDGDRKADATVYQESTGTWIAHLSKYNYALTSLVLGGPGYKAAAVFP